MTIRIFAIFRFRSQFFAILKNCSLRFASHKRKIFSLRFASQFFAKKISLSLRFAILFWAIFGALLSLNRVMRSLAIVKIYQVNFRIPKSRKLYKLNYFSTIMVSEIKFSFRVLVFSFFVRLCHLSYVKKPFYWLTYF